jgi:hypothetical protein
MFPRFIFPVVVIIFFAATDAGAQSAQPRQTREYQPAGLDVPPPEPDIFEASLGFDFLRCTSALAKNEYGGDASLFANLNSWLAVGAEFIGTYGSETHQFSFNHSTRIDESRLVYVAGPRINVWQTDKWKVFVEALGGGAHGRVSALIFGVDRSASADGFAAVIGAGAEWKFSRRIAWRVFETDYIPAHFNGQWEHDWRISTGVSFYFGSGW